MRAGRVPTQGLVVDANSEISNFRYEQCCSLVDQCIYRSLSQSSLSDMNAVCIFKLSKSSDVLLRFFDCFVCSAPG